MPDYSLRLAREADAPGILEIYAPIVRETAISWEYEAPDESTMRGRIRDKADHGYPWIIAERPAEIPGASGPFSAGQPAATLAGYAYAGRWRERQAYDWSCEISVYVHPGHRRRGLAADLYASLFRILAAQGFCYAVAGIALPNPGSLALHEAVGMSLAGIHRAAGFKDGLWRDIAFYEIALGAACSPGPILPVSALVSRGDPAVFPENCLSFPFRLDKDEFCPIK
jgi:phosphinothricin acetyltransferase